MLQRGAKISRSISLALLITAEAPAVSAAQHRLGPIASRVLADYAAMPQSTFRAMLDRLRTPSPSLEVRLRIRATLPAKGEVMPSLKQAEKLLAVQPILQYHRRDGLIEPLLVEAPPAAVGLHARSLILISDSALRLLDSAELQAIAAHELGHDYFWDDFEGAVASGDEERLQELELRCDAVSVFTLADLGLNPRKLASGLARMNEFNARFGPPANVRRYVPAPERARFVEELIERVSGRTGK